MSNIDLLLEQPPYAASSRRHFGAALREAVLHHYERSPHWRALIAAQGYDPAVDHAIEDLPYFPVSMFKKEVLVTGDQSHVQKTIRSSATAGNLPSVITLDATTIARQRVALQKIMSDFLGGSRRPFIVLDARTTLGSGAAELSSRGGAIRGMLPLSSRMDFALRDDLSLEPALLTSALAAVSETEAPCLFGFTWLVHSIMEEIKKGAQADFQKEIERVKDRMTLVHLGGWKKLQERAVSKDEFARRAHQVFGIRPENIIDIYGFTEQLGTVYPDCPYGHKHVSAYTDIIIRHPETLAPQPLHEPGLLQAITPIPNSYPGVSLITDDIGSIEGLDGCPCGRNGKYFIFHRRAETAELRGCGDTI